MTPDDIDRADNEVEEQKGLDYMTPRLVELNSYAFAGADYCANGDGARGCALGNSATGSAYASFPEIALRAACDRVGAGAFGTA